MSIDPNTIKTHAKTMLSTNLTNEINFQYDSVWGKYFRHLIAASATATEAQQNAFKEAEKTEADAQALLGRALWAINIASSLTLSWLSGFVQYRTDTLVTAKLGWTRDVGKIPVPPEYLIKGRFIWRLPRDQLAAKMFGDSVKLVGGLVSDWGIKNFFAEPYKPPNGQKVAASVNLEMLRTNLMDEVDAQKQTILANIDKLANAIENDPEYGQRRLDELLQSQPGLVKAGPTAQERAGYQLINDEINTQRQQWANDKESFYYGYNPPPIDDRKWALSMERDMWVVWLAQNRKPLLEMDMSERQREKSWYQSLVQHMFDINVPGTAAILTSDGEERDDALLALLNSVKKGPPPGMTTPHGATLRTLTSIEQWSRIP